MGKKKARTIWHDITITDYAAEGKALARIDGKVLFIEGAVPGDVADILITKNKKDWAEGRVESISTYSSVRTQPFCIHFGVCGGCKWQMLPYGKQLEYKEQEAAANIKRIGKTGWKEFLPIIGAADSIHYRNKLEFTFSNKRYLLPSEIGVLTEEVYRSEPGALGYHVPRVFDKVIDIRECYLMDEVNNKVRDTIRGFALENKYSFYDIKNHTGWLRNVILRYCTTGELMVNVCLNYEDAGQRQRLLDHLLKEIPAITTLIYTINPKWNDTIYDLEPQVYSGKGYVMENLGDYRFKISPKSFFQTNTKQAEQLYSVARDFAGLTGKETVYDLYCGTGSIGIFLSRGAGKIIGVDVVGDAIKDARENASLNNITHATFFEGDVIKICDDAFFEKHGRPDVIITDPPRVGMHEKMVNKLLEIAAPKIVYISCNTATQARDIALLSPKYELEKVQPVDMFPHTHHIECVVLLKRK